MRLIDLNDGSMLTTADLKREWSELRPIDPENHAETFRTELLEILMATISGRNDLDIIGQTPSETGRLIARLRT